MLAARLSLRPSFRLLASAPVKVSQPSKSPLCSWSPFLNLFLLLLPSSLPPSCNPVLVLTPPLRVTTSSTPDVRISLSFLPVLPICSLFVQLLSSNLQMPPSFRALPTFSNSSVVLTTVSPTIWSPASLVSFRSLRYPLFPAASDIHREVNSCATLQSGQDER